MTLPDSRVSDVPFQTELGDSFGRYAQKVILDRAIPDIRDGLKPVQRRIIYAMYEAGNTHDRPYPKSAKTVGDVMGNYHPHGDASIYEALARMAQPWKMRYPLIDGHGNFGSMDDDPPAAMRYTEARLSELAAELMRDIDADTVPWKQNFDEKTLEPVVLPAGYLNLLVNGAAGVSAGFATDIPSHHFGEVVDATLALMKRPDLDVDQLMRYLPGPDFATGGILMGADGLREAYETGRGKVVLRARHDVEVQDGRTLLVFGELPYNVVKADLVRQMDDMRLAKEVIGVADVRDESDREGLRVVVELTKGADADGVLAYLFKKSDLQINYHFNLVAIAKNTPVQVGLKTILESFIAHRRRVVERRSRHDLAKKQERLHEVDGLIKAIDILDEVIATIRASDDKPDAQKNLVANFDFTELQAAAILELKLHRLTNLELSALTGEAKELEKAIKKLEKILREPKERDRVIAAELDALRARFSDDRRTTIEAEVARLDVDLKVTVKDQEVVVGVTRQGWIKQSSLNSFKTSGATRKTSGVAPGDRMLRLIHTRTTHRVLVFSHTGQCYPVPVHQLPEAKWGETGTSLVNVCGITREEKLVEVLAPGDIGTLVQGSETPHYLLFVTREGLIKMTTLEEFQSTRSAGFVAFKVPDDDALSVVIATDGQGDLILLTADGVAIRFDVSEVPIQGRAAKGVIGMKVERGDRIADAILVPPDDTLGIAVFTRQGRGKLSPLEQLPRQHRGGKGVRMIVARIQNKHECVAVGATHGQDRFELVDSLGNEHLIEAGDIQEVRRDGNAVTLVQLEHGASITAVEKIPFEPEPDGGAT